MPQTWSARGAAARTLDRFEEIWRNRVARMDEILCEPDPGSNPPHHGVDRCP